MTSAEYRAEAEKLLTTYTVGGSLAPGAVEQAAVWAQLAAVAVAAEQGQTPAGETEYVLELLTEDGEWKLRADYDDQAAAEVAMEWETVELSQAHRVVKREVVATTDTQA